MLLTDDTLSEIVGDLTGSLLVAPADDRGPLALGTICLVSGLFLTTTLFLGSLLFSLPSFAGPIAACVVAVAVYRCDALRLPSSMGSWTWSTAGAVLLGLLLLAPTLIASIPLERIFANGQYEVYRFPHPRAE